MVEDKEFIKPHWQIIREKEFNTPRWTKNGAIFDIIKWSKKGIMKYSDKFNEDEQNEINELIEKERKKQIKQLEEQLNYLNNKEHFHNKEICKYNEDVKNNNRGFCICGIRYTKGKFGPNKYKCGIWHCQRREE